MQNTEGNSIATSVNKINNIDTTMDMSILFRKKINEFRIEKKLQYHHLHSSLCTQHLEQ